MGNIAQTGYSEIAQMGNGRKLPKWENSYRLLILFPKFWGATKNIPEISGGDFFPEFWGGHELFFVNTSKKLKLVFTSLVLFLRVT